MTGPRCGPHAKSSHRARSRGPFPGSRSRSPTAAESALRTPGAPASQPCFGTPSSSSTFGPTITSTEPSPSRSAIAGFAGNRLQTRSSTAMAARSISSNHRIVRAAAAVGTDGGGTGRSHLGQHGQALHVRRKNHLRRRPATSLFFLRSGAVHVTLPGGVTAGNAHRRHGVWRNGVARSWRHSAEYG